MAASDESPLYKAKVRKCDEVISIDEELQRGRASLVVMPGFDGQERGYRAGGSVWFEHAEHGFLVHAWPNTAAFTMRMRVLAVLAQRQALAAGTEAPFGNAMKVDDFKGIISTRILRRTGATAIAQSGRADAVQLGMSITGHKSVSMFEKYVQKVNVYASHAPNVSSIVLHQSTSSQGCKALIAAEAAAATESEASMHSRVVVLQEDLARKGATIATLEAELEARKEELDALKMAMIETKRILETQRITTLQIGMDGDEFSTGSGKDPCSRRAKSLGAFCHPAGETAANEQALKEAELLLRLEYAKYEMVPVPKELQKKLCKLGACCTLRDATSMQKRLKSSLTISLARRAAGAAPFLDDAVDALMTSINDDMLCDLPAEFEIDIENELGIKDVTSQIFVKNLNGQTTTVSVVLEKQTVKELKACVQDREGLLCDFWFTCMGSVLDEAALLSDYGIKQHSTVHMHSRMLGGMLQRREVS